MGRRGNRHCGFRPRNAAEAEVGCPLDHCGYCGQHDHEDIPCHEMTISKRHREWRDRILKESFEKWYEALRPRGRYFDGMPDHLEHEFRRVAWDAFMFGYEGFAHEQNELTMGDCGQSDCYDCHWEQMDEDVDPMGHPSRYE